MGIGGPLPDDGTTLLGDACHPTLPMALVSAMRGYAWLFQYKVTSAADLTDAGHVS
ncbi:MAG: hypothetical protein ABIU95_02710 [Burkholderiales bacterium]